MSNTISPTRLRLICREVASRVNARRGREEPTEEAVLLELLRRVEFHLGRKPGTLTASTVNPSRNIMDALGVFLGSGASSSLASILQEELLGKVVVRDEARAVESRSSLSSQA
jgi:hypothetical protein